jgi:tRNA-dihydrouridine synthase
MLNLGFWKNLPRPFFALAPMANVTDAAFRRLVARHACPDVLWTEFVSAHGIASRGRKNLVIDLKYDELERPIVAQFFGSNPAHIKIAAELACEMKFDGIDINMGCPDKNVEKQGSGASLLKKPQLMKELILAAKEGAGDIPVSIKTRTGYHEDSLGKWLPVVLEAEPAAISIHARTRQEMSKVPARWETIAEARTIIDKHFSGADKSLLIGNGDCLSLEDGKLKAAKYGADGIMIGRGIFQDFWVFEQKKKEHTVKDRMLILKEHLDLFEQEFSGRKSFSILKKFFKIYANGFDGAKDLRAKLMTFENPVEVREFLKDYK